MDDILLGDSQNVFRHCYADRVPPYACTQNVIENVEEAFKHSVSDFKLKR